MREILTSVSVTTSAKRNRAPFPRRWNSQTRKPSSFFRKSGFQRPIRLRCAADLDQTIINQLASFFQNVGNPP